MRSSLNVDCRENWLALMLSALGAAITKEVERENAETIRAYGSTTKKDRLFPDPEQALAYMYLTSPLHGEVLNLDDLSADIPFEDDDSKPLPEDEQLTLF